MKRNNFYKSTKIPAFFRYLHLTYFFTIIGVSGQMLYAQNPGNVSSGLTVWYKSDIGVTGNPVSSWADQSGNGINVTQATINSQPATGGMINFNPSLVFDGGNDHLEYDGFRFIEQDDAGTIFAVGLPDGGGGLYQNLATLGTDNPHNGINSSSNEAFLYNTGFSAEQPYIENQAHVFDYYWNGGNALNVGTGTRVNGNDVFDAGGHARNIGGSGSNVDWTIGSQNLNVEVWSGQIAEVILYNRNLTVAEKERVDAYLGLKYGTTLAHNYLAGDGSTVYDISTYGNNVTGIARDDSQGLLQKQSKSVNSGSVLTIGIENEINTNNASHSGNFDATNQFIIAGHNGMSSWSTTSFAGGCYLPESLDYVSDRIWKVQETGDVKSARVQLPLSAFSGSINTTDYPVYLVYGADEGLNTNRVSIQGVVSGGNINFDIDFPANSTGYFGFSGSNAVAACATCSGDPQYVSPGAAFGYGCNGANQNSNTVLGVTSTGGAADISTDFTVTYPGTVAEFIPVCWPRRYGDWLQMIRYDNTTGASGDVLFEASFDKATKPTFDIGSIDYFIGQQDEIEILGYDCNNNVIPNAFRTSLKYPPTASYGSTFGTVDALASGGEGRTNFIYYASPFWKWGTLNVEFTKAVDRIEVKWRQKSRRYSFNYYQYLYISPMTLDCPFIPTCSNPEEIYVNLSFDKPAYSTCDTATMNLRLKNFGCGPQTIDLQNVLPAGVTYLAGSLNANQLVNAGGAAGIPNAYGGTNTFNWTGFILPIGEYTVPIQVVGTSNITSNVQADFQISGGDIGQSDYSSTNSCQATPLNFTLETPPDLPEVSIATTETCYDPSGQLNYTITIDNPTGGILSQVNMSIPLSLDFTIVNSSVAYSSPTLISDGNFRSNTVDENGLIQLDNLTIPVGTSTIQFTTNANTSDTTATPFIIISADVTSSCGAAMEKIVTDTIEYSLDPNASTCDMDGDGVVDSAENAGEENEPCLPAQSAGYTNYDSGNATWAAADCDSDGVSNIQEVVNGTDPYDSNNLPNSPSCLLENVGMSYWHGDGDNQNTIPDDTGDDEDNDDYIGFTNFGISTVDISGWQLFTDHAEGNSTSPVYTFPVGTMLLPNETVIVVSKWNTPPALKDNFHDADYTTGNEGMFDETSANYWFLHNPNSLEYISGNLENTPVVPTLISGSSQVCSFDYSPGLVEKDDFDGCKKVLWNGLQYIVDTDCDIIAFDDGSFSGVLDTDGDGVMDINEVLGEETDPCLPIQTETYTGFDSANPIWRAGNCDGDADNNGAEADAGASPYCNFSTVSNPSETCVCETSPIAPTIIKN